MHNVRDVGLRRDVRAPNGRTNKGLRTIGPLLDHLGSEGVDVYQDEVAIQ